MSQAMRDLYQSRPRKEVQYHMFQNIGTTEIIIIAVVLMILFGAKKLPEFARGLGESGRELKKAGREFKKAVTEDPDEDK
jgi:sec-independent protein translocase protein TatA